MLQEVLNTFCGVELKQLLARQYDEL